ncbi:MAG: hypothetical protein ACOZF2_10590 [Thermodesulfobacteriota bacterium]
MTSVISASATVIVAALSFFLNKRAERKAALQQRKLAHYQELINALSDLVNDLDQDKANLRFNNAFNTMALVAPQNVIDSLMKFHDQIRISNPNKSEEGYDRTLKELLLAIRKSLEMPFRDDPHPFNFHLVGSLPKSKRLK